MNQLVNLIDSLLWARKENLHFQNEFEKKNNLFEQILGFGPEAANAALEMLPQYKMDILETCLLLKIVSATATTEHQHRLVESLLWDEIALNSWDRSAKSMIVENLKRIGDESVIPFLRQYAEKVKNTNYSIDPVDFETVPSYYFNTLDQSDIKNAIAAIQKRVAAT